MAWSFHVPRWFNPTPAPRPPRADVVGDHLRAAVNEHARVKAEGVRAHERRIQSMIDDLFVRMGDRNARLDP